MAKPIVFLALGERIFGSVGLCPKIVANIQNVILMESEAKIKKAFFWRLVQSDEYNVNGVVQVSLWLTLNIFRSIRPMTIGRRSHSHVT